MKKTTLLLSMFAIAVLGFSQEKTIRFGIQIGGNISNIESRFTYASSGITYSTKLPSNSISGITAGVQAEIPLLKDFYLQPELSYIQLGAKNVYEFSTWDSTIGKLELKGILHYVSLPVLVKYKIPKTGAGIFAGPQFSYLAGVTNKINETTIKGKGESNYKTDFAAIFGAEYYLPIGLGASARYQLGISNIQKPEYFNMNSLPRGVTGKTISVRNTAFSFAVGYRF